MRRRARRPPGTRTPTARVTRSRSPARPSTRAGLQQHRRRRPATTSPRSMPDGRGHRLEPERERHGLRAGGLGLDRLRRRGVHQRRRPGPQRHRRARRADRARRPPGTRTRTARCTPWRVSGSTVYAGGTFTSDRRRRPRQRSPRSTHQTGAPTAWNPNANGTVDALAVSGSTVYAGGTSRMIGGQAATASPRSMRRRARRPPGTRTPTTASTRSRCRVRPSTRAETSPASAGEPQPHRRARCQTGEVRPGTRTRTTRSRRWRSRARPSTSAGSSPGSAA